MTSERTLYSYVNQGLLSARNIDIQKEQVKVKDLQTGRNKNYRMTISTEKRQLCLAPSKGLPRQTIAIGGSINRLSFSPSYKKLIKDDKDLHESRT